MIQAIVTLGRALGLELVAEGVETEEQRVILRLAGCDEMQGYLFAVPGPREALDRLIADNRAASVSHRELADLSRCLPHDRANFGFGHWRKLTARRRASIMAETTVQSRERP